MLAAFSQILSENQEQKDEYKSSKTSTLERKKSLYELYGFFGGLYGVYIYMKMC